MRQDGIIAGQAVCLDDGRSLVRAAIVLASALLLVRLVVIGQLGFFADEAYYWVWSQDLAFGYYDHPPIVALFIRAGTFLFGDTPFGARFVTTVSVAVDTLLVYAIANTLFQSRRVAAWAAIFASLTTMTTAAVVIVPDQPMILFWLVALLGMAKIARGGRPQWWLLVGAMLGLAMASKYTTLFLLPAIPIWLAVVPSLRKWLRSPWPYAGAALALLVFLPVLIWSAQHDWASFANQYNRDTVGDLQIASFLVYFLYFPLMITPPILYLALRGTADLVRSKRPWAPGPALLLITPIPLLLFLAYHSLREFDGIHWISPIVCVACILAAVPLGQNSPAPPLRRDARAATVSVWVGLAVILGFNVFLFDSLMPFSPDSDFTTTSRGWVEFAETIDDRVEEADADYIVAPTYGIASELRFYMQDTEIPIYQLGEWERLVLGDAPEALADGTALYVGASPDHAVEQAHAETYFETVEYAGLVGRQVRGDYEVAVATFILREPRPAAEPLFGSDDAVPLRN